MQTASAATPLFLPRATALAPEQRPVDTDTSYAAGSPTPFDESNRLHQDGIRRAPAFMAERPPFPPQGRRVPPHYTKMQASLFAGAFTAIVGLIFGVVWWADSASNSKSLQASSASATRLSSADAKQPGLSVTNVALAPSSRGTTVGNDPDSGARNAVRNMPAQSSQSPSDQAAQYSSAVAKEVPFIASDTNKRKKPPVVAASSAPRKSANANQYRPSASRATTLNKEERVEEIRRLKAQAFSETQKDRTTPADNSSPKSSDRDPQAAGRIAIKNTSSVVKQTSLANEFNQCKRKSSFLDREKCKWRVCAGKWGQDGCPAYNYDVPRY